MVEIKENEKINKTEPVNAETNGKDIIPGISGEEIDINKSYSNMKKLGYYKETLLEYKKTNPEITIKNNFDYYITNGNLNKNLVNLILIINKETSVSKIEDILDISRIKKVKLNFFIDGYFFEKNNDLINIIASEGHDIGNLSYNKDYKDSSFVWMDTIIKKITNKKYSYCYLEKEEETSHKICSLHNNYVVKPKTVIKDNYFISTKSNIEKYSIIAYELEMDFEKEIPLIINYIRSKGKTIDVLKKLIEE